MEQISGSVGLGGRNHPIDVLTVQRLLLRAGVSPGPLDHRCGIRTMHAIEHFQRGFLHRPDGRVDVHGTTWRHLLGPHGAERTSQAHSHPSPTSKPTRTSLPIAPSHRPPTSEPTSKPTSPAHTEPSSYWQAITPLTASSEANHGLQSPPNRLVLSLLGPPTGAKTEALIVSAHVGPMHVTGLRPAITSLTSIIAKVQQDLPSLYGLLRTPGMRAVRNVRGHSNISNHSWGIAIDIQIGAVLIPLGSHYSVRGVDALVPYFHAAGWYWGGGYHGRKDPMHFECSSSLLRSFAL